MFLSIYFMISVCLLPGVALETQWLVNTGKEPDFKLTEKQEKQGNYSDGLLDIWVSSVDLKFIYTLTYSTWSHFARSVV